MKMKKITAFIVAILSVLSIVSFAPIAKVNAAQSVEFVQSFNSYSLSYVTGRFTTEEADGYKYKATDAAEFGEVITGDHVFAGDVSKTYDIVVLKGETEVTTGTFGLINKTADGSIYYDIENLDERANYEKLIYNKEDGADATGKLAGKKIGDSFTYPDLEGLLVSDHFAYATLKSNLTLYYAKPKSTTFTSTTSKSFTLSELGTYSYYVLAKDPTGTEFTIDTDELELKDGALGNGWYNGNDLVVPVFTFEFTTISQPEITISEKVEEGYIGLAYQDAKEYITIVAENEKVEYTLYYSATKFVEGDDWASVGVETVETTAIDISEDEDYAFNSSNLSFTPQEKGYYYIVVNVVDGNGIREVAVTYSIAVNHEFTEVKYNTQFWKYNWLSMMFLGIALLCLIGIILIIFVKPKEEVEEEVTTVAKK